MPLQKKSRTQQSNLKDSELINKLSTGNRRTSRRKASSIQLSEAIDDNQAPKSSRPEEIEEEEVNVEENVSGPLLALRESELGVQSGLDEELEDDEDDNLPPIDPQIIGPVPAPSFTRLIASRTSQKHSRSSSTANIDKDDVTRPRLEKQCLLQERIGSHRSSTPQIPSYITSEGINIPSSPPILQVTVSPVSTEFTPPSIPSIPGSSSLLPFSDSPAAISGKKKNRARSIKDMLSAENAILHQKIGLSLDVWWLTDGLYADSTRVQQAIRRQVNKLEGPIIFPGEIPADLIDYYHKRIQGHRSHLAAAARSLVPTVYKLANEDAQSIKSRVAYLLTDNRFLIDERYHNTASRPLFSSRAISDVIIKYYYNSLSGWGFQCPDLWRHLSGNTIAFVSAHLYLGLKQYETGIKNTKVSAKSVDVQEAFDRMVQAWFHPQRSEGVREKSLQIFQRPIRAALSRLQSPMVGAPLPEFSQPGNEESALNELLCLPSSGSTNVDW